jgi:hypothetical protein
VIARAEGICEYCQITEDDTFYGCEVDHVISEKHGGPTEEANLAFACVCCNSAKGSDVGSIEWESGEFIRFFNPRTDRWADHFVLVDCRIEKVTYIGAVTARVLGFNTGERVLERQTLQDLKRYPSAAALKRMNELTATMNPKQPDPALKPWAPTGSPADDFDVEVELLKNNPEFMTLMNQLSQEQAVISLPDLRKELGIQECPRK